MKRLLTLTVSGLFPILGLFSCSKDKPQDSWTLTEPTISSASLGRTPVTVASLQRLPADAELVFNAAEMSGARIVVESECKSPVGVTKGRLEFPGAPSVSLKALWPRELWILEDSEGLKKSSCKFEFQALHGNTVHHFTMQNVRLIDFASTLASPTESTSETEKVDSNFFGNAGDAYVDRLNILASPNAEIHFLCETFSNQKKPHEFIDQAPNHVIALSDMLDELAEGNIQSTTGADPRYRKAVQRCRLLKLTSERSGLPQYELSPSFEHRFRPPQISLNATDGFRSASAATWRNLNIFTIEVKNETDAPTAVTLPANLGNVRLRLAGRQQPERIPPVPVGAFFLSAKIMSEPVHLLSSATRSWTSQGLRIFEVPARSSVILSGNLNTGATCYADVNLDPGTFAASRNMGVLFGYEQSVELTQFRQWDSEIPDFNSERIVQASVGHFPMLKDGHPIYFKASEAYVQTVDPNGEAPQFTHAYPDLYFERVEMKRRKLCWFNRTKTPFWTQLPE